MFALSAREHTGTTETLSLFRYPAPEGWKEVQCRGNAGSGERRLLNDAEEMMNLASGERVSMMDFPGEINSACADCRFAAVCSAIAEQFGAL